jgi:Xaa-Pro aminopeptidase
VGLQIHEAPRLSAVSTDILAEGHVFTIEPGLYLPGEFGVRFENTFVIQDGQAVCLN